MSPIRLRVREFRVAKGWTQAELADASGVRRATISTVESGKAKGIHFAILERLALALGVDAAVLIEHGRTAARPGTRKRRTGR